MQSFPSTEWYRKSKKRKQNDIVHIWKWPPYEVSKLFSCLTTFMSCFSFSAKLKKHEKKGKPFGTMQTTTQPTISLFFSQPSVGWVINNFFVWFKAEVTRLLLQWSSLSCSFLLHNPVLATILSQWIIFGCESAVSKCAAPSKRCQRGKFVIKS